MVPEGLAERRRGGTGERRSIYNQVTEFTNRIKQQGIVRVNGR
jgi:hypothetical protein